MATAFILFGALFFLGHALKWLFYRTKVPDILVLVILGQVLGPVTGLVQPDSLGDVGRFLAEMALVVILLEGGIGLSLTLLRQSTWPALKVTLGGLILSVPLATLVVKGLTDLPWVLAA